jgi:nitric oxide reductase subunit B
MHASRKLWTWLAVICVLSFFLLGWAGTEIFLNAPPMPPQVASSDGDVVFSEGQVQHGQKAWLSAGGQQLGFVWGHGSYLTPDWLAQLAAPRSAGAGAARTVCNDPAAWPTART